MPSTTEQRQPKKPAQTSFIGALQQLIKTRPDQTWVYYPKTADLKHGWNECTYRDLAYAVDALSRWIDTNVEITSPGEVIAYMGVNDTKYILVLLALMNLNLKTMLPSPRNSAEGQSNLFKVTECKTLLYSEAFDIKPTLETLPGIASHQIPTFEELIKLGKEQEPFPSRHCPEENDTAFILHTSGSTGLPKPIYLTYGYIAVLGAARDLPKPEGRDNMADLLVWHDKPMFTMMPFFHIASSMAYSRSLFAPGPLVVCPTGRPVNTEVVIEVLNQTKPSTGLFAPSVLEDLSSTNEGLDALGKLDFIAWSGAPISFEAGDRVAKKTRLSTLIGATEIGMLATLMPEDPADWHYYEWNTNAGIVMDPEADGLFECVVRPNEERTFQGIFHTFPDLKEYRTKDIYERHPTKPDLYHYMGRKDDVLVLSNGEKVQPVTFEKMVEDHHLVHGVVVVGEGRFQTGVVIEPIWELIEEGTKPEDFIEDLWPTIEQANLGLPSHGKVWKTKIAIAKRDRPFIRAGKGSIIRRQTVNLYKTEIDALYANESFDEQLGKLAPDADVETVQSFIRQALEAVSPDFPSDATNDTDFFSTGFDSLQVLGLSTVLSHACDEGEAVSIGAKDIYANPSISALADYILQARGKGETVASRPREEVIMEMLEKYTKDLPERSLPEIKRPEKHTVVLTGSTGGLGNYILQDLIDSPQVSHVYCLNRSAGAEERQRKSFESRNVTPNFDQVTFLETDFSKDLFGLEKSTYENLLETTTVFIHNAWAVDFNKTLSSYEQTHVAGTRRVVDFCIASKYNANVYFVSSVASVQGWLLLHPNDPNTTVPETTFTDPHVTISQGYSESKYVAEHILRIASERSKIPNTIIRSGQLCGPSTVEGIWNPNEWFPSIASTSKAMNMIPATLGAMDLVDWVPLNIAADILVDLVFARADDYTSSSPVLHTTYHLVNPRTTLWSSLIPALSSAFGPSAHIVPYSEWVGAVSQIDTTNREEVQKKPAIKLLDFYQGIQTEVAKIPNLETKVTETRSRSMQELKAVDGELMGRWLRQWGLVVDGQ